MRRKEKNTWCFIESTNTLHTEQNEKKFLLAYVWSSWGNEFLWIFFVFFLFCETFVQTIICIWTAWKTAQQKQKWQRVEKRATWNIYFPKHKCEAEKKKRKIKEQNFVRCIWSHMNFPFSCYFFSVDIFSTAFFPFRSHFLSHSILFRFYISITGTIVKLFLYSLFIASYSHIRRNVYAHCICSA